MTTCLLAADNPLDHVVQHSLVQFGQGFWSFPIISNHIIMQVVAAALLLWVIAMAVKARAGHDEVGRLVPRGIGNAIEGICEFLRDRIARPNLGHYTDLFIPYLWTVFFFILSCNLLGMIPLSDWFFFVPYHQIGGTSTGNIYVTATFAVLTLILVVYNGLRYHGMAYVKHFFMGPWYLSWFIAILEVAGLGFKTMALAVRLFANMLGGHILLAVLLGFCGAAFAVSTAVGIPITLVVIASSVGVNMLELLVAFLQAFIFTVLTAVFIGQAVNIHHDEHEQAESEEGQAAHH
jgi:F-type H+-transporting ATPase subunit a